MWWIFGICIAVGVGFSLLYLRKGFVLRNYLKITARCSLEDLQKMREDKKLPLCFLMEEKDRKKEEYFVLFTPNKKFLERKALFLDLVNRKVFSMDRRFLFRLNKSFVLGRIEEGKVVEKVLL